MATSVQTVDSAHDLGVVVNSYLAMKTHVSAMCHVAYYQLRQLRPLICSVLFDATKLLVQAFISTCLDYCNSLLCHTGSATTCIDAYKPFKMLQHAS